MKAVLVVDDMPKGCLKCPYCGFREEDENKKVCMFMSHAYVLTGNLRERNAFCPLKPLPEEMKEGFTHDFMVGWNACIDAITGEKEWMN